MATKILAQLDLATSIRTKNIAVPPMKAVVTWDNPDALKGYDSKKEKIIVQSLIATAFDSLNEAQKEIKLAIEAFDAELTKKPAADEKAALDRVRTFQNTCKQIANAQEAKAQKAVENAWAMHKKRDAALTKMNLVFSAKIALAALSLAASITIAALSLGTLAVTIVSAAKTCVSTALLIKDFAVGRDKVAAEVYSTDQTLWKVYMGPAMKGKSFRTAKEVAAAAGIPFLDTVGKLEKRVEDFLGASARVDKQNQKLYTEANGLMAKIQKLDATKIGDANKKVVDKLGLEVKSLLDEVGKLSKSIDGDNKFYKTYCDRCAVYNAMNGKAVSTGATVITLGVLAAGIASTAKSAVEIALKLA